MGCATAEDEGSQKVKTEFVVSPSNQIESRPLWTNNSSSFKITANGWLSMITINPLPQHFSAKIKVIDLCGVNNCSNGGIGITKKQPIVPNLCIGTELLQYGIMTQFNGKCFLYGGDKSPKLYGTQYGRNDVITIIYKKDKTLSFEINDRSQGTAFTELEGPFYLMASLFFSGSELQILSVNNLD